MRVDTIQTEKKAWLDLSEELKAISKQIQEGKEIDKEMTSLSKSIKKYKLLFDKKTALSKETVRL